ncbi:hypothetical protein U1Q18_023968 [Sarracenia purpurea var. burkii]
MTVPISDDPKQPALTFRTWVLGLCSCAVLAFVNQFFGFRENQLYVGSVSAQILVLPIGRLMAATLPDRRIRVPFTKRSFSINPGPFTLKEHVLITIFANSGSNSVYAVNIITIVKAFYHRQLNPYAGYLLSMTTQMLGYGWAGLFRRYLVDSPYMWWPANLVQVSLFRALNEKERRRKGDLTRLQFFLMVFTSSFAYYLIPSYLFPSITALSVGCWIWKDSITAQQISSGLHGIGIGSIGIDWSTVAGFLGSPLAYPPSSILNVIAGFILTMYIMVPIAYWTNSYEAKRFPYFSSHTFDSTGHRFNITRVLNAKTFNLDKASYDAYSKLYLSVFFAFSYGLSFATLTAAISHVGLFHGNTAWWLITTIEHICDPALLPPGSPWTCPGDDVFYNASIIWGVVGPMRMFTKQGIYPQLNWFFVIGFLSPFPVWILSLIYPQKKWIKLINMPVILGATMMMPPARAVNYTTWAVVGLFFNVYIYRKYKQWWARHTYILSAALDAGVAFMGVIIYFALQSRDIIGPQWWGLDMDDHCPLANCPTAPGIQVAGCPML